MKRLSAPLDIQLEITEHCNQNCKHCYNYWRQDPLQPKDELDLQGFVSIIDQASDAGVGTITFTGGEPLLRKQTVVKLIAHARSHQIDTGLNSNGTLIDAAIAHDLRSAGLNHALISLLGPEVIHNSIGGGTSDFHKTINGITLLVETGMSVAVNMVVSKFNIHVLRDTARIVKDIGVRTFCAGPMIPSCQGNIPICLSRDECISFLRDLIRVSRDLDMDIDVLEPLPRCMFYGNDEADFARLFSNRICSAAVSSCAISSSGVMRPCIHSDICFGSVLPDKFLTAWQSMSSWASPEMFPEQCRTCNALMVCEAGCRMSAKVFSGSYNGRDMYMTEPIMDIKRATMRSSQISPIDLKVDDLLEYNKCCILRKEATGYIAYLNGRVEFISPSGFEFVSAIKPLGVFSLRQVAEKFGYPEDELKPVLERLLNIGLLQKIK